MRAGRVALILGATVLGSVLGWMAAQSHVARHGADLFSPKPWRRFAALGALAGRATPASVPLLRDYLAWESSPALRRQARRLLRHLLSTLDEEPTRA